jgi:hypothetical protein
VIDPPAEPELRSASRRECHREQRRVAPRGELGGCTAVTGPDAEALGDPQRAREAEVSCRGRLVVSGKVERLAEEADTLEPID